MLYSIPVMSFHGGNSRQGRQCSRFDPSACLSPQAGLPHHLFRRGPRRHEPTLVHDIAGLWKALARVSERDEEMPHQTRWTKRVRCEGFAPEEITVSISEQKVIVQGLREFTDDEGTSEVRKMKRTIVIPPEVNPDSVKAFVKQDGTLVLKGEGKSASVERKISIEKTQGDTTQSIGADHTGNEPTKSNEADCTSTDENETCVMKIVDKESKIGNYDEMINETETSGKNADTETEVLDTVNVDKSNLNEVDKPKDVPVSKESEEEFKIEVDMSKFKPESVVVKSTADSVTIVGKQDEVDQKTGKVNGTKTLLRKFFLPVSVNSDLLTSQLSNGNLTVSGPYIK